MGGLENTHSMRKEITSKLSEGHVTNCLICGVFFDFPDRDRVFPSLIYDMQDGNARFIQ